MDGSSQIPDDIHASLNKIFENMTDMTDMTDEIYKIDTKSNNTTIQQYNNTIIQQYNNTIIQQYNITTIQQYNNCILILFNFAVNLNSDE
jgi:hypothetical protein